MRKTRDFYEGDVQWMLVAFHSSVYNQLTLKIIDGTLVDKARYPLAGTGNNQWKTLFSQKQKRLRRQPAC